MEYSEGGLIPGGPVEFDRSILIKGCDYIIPIEFARKWAEALDKINKGEYSSVEVADETSTSQEDL